MKQLTIVLFLALVCSMGCSKHKAEPSPETATIAKAEDEAYQFLMAKITTDLRTRFSSNPTERDRITPEETQEAEKIGIPDNVGYIFYKGNAKYLKGDLNGDKKVDLIISAGMVDVNTPEKNVYFVFLQDETGYTLFSEFRAEDIVSDFCDKNKMKNGEFNLESVAGGLLVGKSRFHKGDESSYNDYGYSIDQEKYKLNVAAKKLELVSQSDLLKKNDKTGTNEKIDIVK